MSAGCFSILFGSMFLEICNSECGEMLGICEFQYPLWIDVFGNLVHCLLFPANCSRFSILFGSMFLEIPLTARRTDANPQFQYPLWIDVFGNVVGARCVICAFESFSILFGSMFLEMQAV